LIDFGREDVGVKVNNHRANYSRQGREVQ
jgi:hypothetical protein